jgi:hypothetical protein
MSISTIHGDAQQEESPHGRSDSIRSNAEATLEVAGRRRGQPQEYHIQIHQ